MASQYTSKTYDNPMCIIDSSLAPQSLGNYVDCTSALMQSLGKTECCQIDTSKGCCKPGGSWDQFKLVGIILGVVTVSLYNCMFVLQLGPVQAIVIILGVVTVSLCKCMFVLQLGPVQADRDHPGWEQFKLIGIILGVVTVSLAIFLIYWFWCRKNNPAVQRVEHFVTQRYHRVQEKCSCFGCCRRSVEKRKHEEEMRQRAKEVPAFDLPMESGSKDPSFDTFWNGPLVKS